MSPIILVYFKRFGLLCVLITFVSLVVYLIVAFLALLPLALPRENLSTLVSVWSRYVFCGLWAFMPSTGAAARAANQHALHF